MSGGGKGVSSAQALSNAITNLAVTGHKFWQPNVQQDSITAQFNYNSIQLQQNSITFLSITTNQTGPKSFIIGFSAEKSQYFRPICTLVPQ
ncbi:hypothetical protein LXL04_039038 [Taraxacum kok-saghyz]